MTFTWVLIAFLGMAAFLVVCRLLTIRHERKYPQRPMKIVTRIGD